MLAIGRGLMGEPRLLILDEPSLGLSPLLVEEMFALIRRLHADGLAILLVEQNVVQSLAIAHRAYVLEGGVVALPAAPASSPSIPACARAIWGIKITFPHPWLVPASDAGRCPTSYSRRRGSWTPHVCGRPNRLRHLAA